MSFKAAEQRFGKARPKWPGFFCVPARWTSSVLALIVAAALSGCQAAPSARLGTAQSIAQSASMAEHDIAAPPFLLRSYERIGDASRPARVYIEGDGLAWLSKRRASPDPTPINPVALSLARADKGVNVVYLARPCQYNRSHTGGACPPKYWQEARFAPEVIAAMNHALDDIKRRHGLRRIELVGFSGGAAIALLMTAERRDVVSVRTVAGNLDTDTFSRLHDVSPMSASLNPASVARHIGVIPQRHFVGGKDDVVPVGIFNAYRSAAGKQARVSLALVGEASHETGWVERWPGLLDQRVP
jgi:hypothetical protein